MVEGAPLDMEVHHWGQNGDGFYFELRGHGHQNYEVMITPDGKVLYVRDPRNPDRLIEYVINDGYNEHRRERTLGQDGKLLPSSGKYIEGWYGIDGDPVQYISFGGFYGSDRRKLQVSLHEKDGYKFGKELIGGNVEFIMDLIPDPDLMPWEVKDFKQIHVRYGVGENGLFHQWNESTVAAPKK